MATTNHSQFSDESCELAEFAAALSHPARIRIIQLLQEWVEAPCGRIVEALPLSQASVSQHLQYLGKAGLLLQRACGKRICYSIDCHRVREFCHTFQCTLGTAGEPPAVTREPCCPDEAASETHANLLI